MGGLLRYVSQTAQGMSNRLFNNASNFNTTNTFKNAKDSTRSNSSVSTNASSLSFSNEKYNMRNKYQGVSLNNTIGCIENKAKLSKISGSRKLNLMKLTEQNNRISRTPMNNKATTRSRCAISRSINVHTSKSRTKKMVISTKPNSRISRTSMTNTAASRSRSAINRSKINTEIRNSRTPKLAYQRHDTDKKKLPVVKLRCTTMKTNARSNSKIRGNRVKSNQGRCTNGKVNNRYSNRNIKNSRSTIIHRSRSALGRSKSGINKSHSKNSRIKNTKGKAKSAILNYKRSHSNKINCRSPVVRHSTAKLNKNKSKALLRKTDKKTIIKSKKPRVYKPRVKKMQTKTEKNSKGECNIDSILNHIHCESTFKVENESLKCESVNSRPNRENQESNDTKKE